MARKSFSVDYKINGVKHWVLELIVEEDLTNEASRISSNKTTLKYELYLRDVASSYTFSNYKIGRSVSINGATVYNTARADSDSLSLENGKSLQLAYGYTTVAHNDDGTKSISVSYSMDMAKASYTPGPLSGSGTMTLTTIARASQPTLSSTAFNMGSAITIYTNRKSKAFTHTVECFNASNARLFQIGDSKKVTDSISWNTDNLFSNCKNAQSLSGYIKLTTYNGSTQIGTAKTVNFKATVPDTVDYRPSASMTLEPTPATIGGLSGVTEYVQGKSYVNATISATPKKSASMKRYAVEVGGVQAGVDSSETDYTIKSALLTGSGNVTVNGYAKDTRGMTTQVQDTIFVTPYGNPYVSSHPSYGIKCFRCDENGNAADDGTRLKYQFKTTWYSLESDKNDLKCYVRLQSVDEDSGLLPITGTAYGGGADNGYKRWYNFDGILNNYTMDVTNSYKVTFTFTDTIGSSAPPLEFSIPSSSVDFHLWGNKAAFGKYAEYDKTLEISEDWSLRLNGANVNDHVVETGTRNGWIYRIRNSGVAECFCRYEEENISLTNNYSGFYYSGTISVEYPFKFKEQPVVIANGGSTDRVNFVRSFAGNNEKAGFIVVGVQSQSNFRIVANIYAVGLLEKGEQ